jgi:hypothetical protein
MGEQKLNAFQIIGAIRVAARDYIRKAPQTEDEWRGQDYALQRDQNTIWYEQDFVPLLRPFASSKKWGERFRLLQSEKNQEAVLSEVRENIEQQNLTQAVGLALLAWSEEFLKNRQLQGKNDYSPPYVEEQLKKLEQWREYALDVDQEGCSFRDYQANRQAARWLNAADQPQHNTETAADQPSITHNRSKMLLFFDECFEIASEEEKAFHLEKGEPHRPKAGSISQRDYLRKLFKKYHRQEPTQTLLETFERQFRSYKADKLSG